MWYTCNRRYERKGSMNVAKHMAGAPEKTQRTHLKHESEKQPVQADTGKRYRAEVPQSETSYDNGKRYKKEKTESSRPKREEHTSTHSNPTRTISEGGMNHLAARLEERDERRYAACRAAYGERRTQQSPARLRTEDEPVVRKSKAMKTARMKLPAHVLKSRAKLIFGGAAGIVAVLVITALLAMPHQNAEPVEAAAEPEALAAATPTPEPAFQQLGDWRLVLVNSEVPLPDDFQMTPTLFDTITVNSKMYPELTALINAAYNDEINLWVASGYRSVEEQESVLDRAVQRRMADGMTYEKRMKTRGSPFRRRGTASITPALRSILTTLKTISARRKPTHGCRSTPQNTALSSATPKARRASPASITSRGITATSARSTRSA